MKKWTEPSPSDWDRWEERLSNGEDPKLAAEAERQTCSSFKRSDPARHAEALAAGRDARADELDRRLELWATDESASDQVKLYAHKYHAGRAGRIAEQIAVTHGGSMEVTNPDVAAAIDRLTSGIVRLAARAAERNAALNPHPGSQSAPGLPVGRLVGEVESGRAAG